jgi:hypothetical protein
MLLDCTDCKVCQQTLKSGFSGGQGMTEHNYGDDYTESYLDQLSKSFERSRELGFGDSPRVDTNDRMSDSTLAELQGLIYEEVYPLLKGQFHFYWGNSCQLLSAHAFAVLVAWGYKAEIIIGEVDVNGTLEFDTAIESLVVEMRETEQSSQGQEVHVWVSLGADIIVDCGLPDRMIKNYKVPERYMPPIMIDRASNLSRKFRARHMPMLIGDSFLAKTNELDTHELVLHYRKRFGTE